MAVFSDRILSVVSTASLLIPWSDGGNETLTLCMAEKLFLEAEYFHDKERVRRGPCKRDGELSSIWTKDEFTWYCVILLREKVNRYRHKIHKATANIPMSM